MSEHQPPTAAKKATSLTVHGDRRIDHYYWMRERADPAVVAYLNAENAYTERSMAPFSTFQDQLYDEIIGRIKPTDMSVPYLQNGYYYQTQYQTGQEYPIYARRRNQPDAPIEIMLDVNKLAQSHEYYQVGARTVSPDQRILAFGVDTLSRRIYTIKFLDLARDVMLVEELKNTTGRAVWSDDNQTIFYTRKDETLRPAKIFKHVLGTDQAQDVEVYHEKDDTYYTRVYKSKSNKYIFIASFATLSTEYRFIRADDPDGQWQVFQPRHAKHEYYLEDAGDHFLIRTNWWAKNFRLMRTSYERTGQANWQEVVPHDPKILIDDVDAFAKYVVLSVRKNGVTKLQIIPKNGAPHYIDFKESSYTVHTITNYEYETDVLRLAYSSLKTPTTVFDYDMNAQLLSMLKQQPVLGNYDPSDYQTDRLMVTAGDGTVIPISLVYRSDFKKDGSQPLLLYGYGSYGHSTDPTFRSSRLSLLDRGFAFAIAHVRGGEEMGRQWYEDGKLLKKKNTFSDFIDCAEYLIAKKYTSSNHLYALGGSAGGLLIGAVINMAPSLFRGVIAAVPFVDVVTTMLDESIPLTTGEYDEWGNPNDPEFYHYMKSYSPYDNVTPQAYPAMLVTTGLHDSQVQYWEPAKWVAKVRAIKTNHQLLLLHTNMDTGHSGASGRFTQHKETALEYTFLLMLADKIGAL